MSYPDDRWKAILEGDRWRLIDLGWILVGVVMIPIILLSEVGCGFQWLYLKIKGGF